MRTNYTDRARFLAAVAAAGLTIRLDPPEHEGMHEDDMYGNESAVDAAGAEYGFGGYVAEYAYEAMLCDTPDAFIVACHEDADYQYEVFDADGLTHGTFATMDEARGCVDFDRLSGWSIWDRYLDEVVSEGA